mmetsp:Transcript_16583/g.38250  ORF Transcript_16583/g.38250 Transcript_16583/m.38250 type:complete len:200 (-) Transcript_16583:1337-1936(-)
MSTSPMTRSVGINWLPANAHPISPPGHSVLRPSASGSTCTTWTIKSTGTLPDVPPRDMYTVTWYRPGPFFGSNVTLPFGSTPSIAPTADSQNMTPLLSVSAVTTASVAAAPSSARNGPPVGYRGSTRETVQASSPSQATVKSHSAISTLLDVCVATVTTPSVGASPSAAGRIRASMDPVICEGERTPCQKRHSARVASV